MGYERLEKSLIDLVKEEQAKLGYRKEMIRLYYPLSSLNHFMETNADSEEMQELLADFPKAAEDGRYRSIVPFSFRQDRGRTYGQWRI